MATATGSRELALSRFSMERPLFLLLTGQLISQTGENLYRVALLWFVSLSSHHVTDMVLVGVLQTLPPLLLGGPGGVWLDRHDKKRLMIGVDLLRAFCVLLIPLLAGLHLLTHARLFLLVFLVSALSGLFGPALSSILPLIVPREHLLRGNALLQTTGQVGLLAGPVIAGLLAVVWSASGEMILTGVAFFLSALFLVFIRTPSSPANPRPSVETKSRPGMRAEIAEGIRFVLAPPRPLLPAFLFMALFGLVTGPLNIMLLLLSRHDLSRGATGFDDLTGAFGAGMLLSTLIVTVYTPKNVIRFVVAGFALAGFLSFGVVETRSYRLDLALFFFWGAAVNVVSPLSQTMIQHLTPPTTSGSGPHCHGRGIPRGHPCGDPPLPSDLLGFRNAFGLWIHGTPPPDSPSGHRHGPPSQGVPKNTSVLCRAPRKRSGLLMTRPPSPITRGDL